MVGIETSCISWLVKQLIHVGWINITISCINIDNWSWIHCYCRLINCLDHSWIDWSLFLFICHSHRMLNPICWSLMICILKHIVMPVENTSSRRTFESWIIWHHGGTIKRRKIHDAIIANNILWSPLAEAIFEENDCILCLNLLSLNDICEHVLISLNENSRISLSMDKLFISISLDALHQGVDGKLLPFS